MGADVDRRRWGPLALLEAATLLSGTGNGVAFVALPWLVLERTDSATAAGVLAAATALPLLLSSLFSGTVVDLVGRRRVSLVSDGLSAASVLAIPLIDATTGLSVPVLVGLAVLGAVFDPAGITAREAMLPAAARAARVPLERANGLHESVWGMAYLVGPGVGGLLVAVVGATGALWTTAVGFTLSILLVLCLRLEGSGRPAHPQRPRGLWRGTAEGLGFVWRDAPLRAVALLSVALVGAYLPIEGVLLPVHFQAQGAPERMGLLIAAMSGGGIAGALAYGAWGERLPKRPVLVGALVTTALAVLGMAVLPPYPVMVVFGGLVGCCYGPVAPIVNTALQQRTPEHLRGRAVGVLASTEYAAGPLGYLAAGPLVEWLGLRPTFLAIALTVLVVALCAIPLRALRRLDADVAPAVVGTR